MPRHFVVILTLVFLLGIEVASAQTGAPASWFDPSADYVKVAIVEDGVHAIPLADVIQRGMLPSGVDPATFRLYARGREIPVAYDETNDALVFVGERNRGDGEAWAYDGHAEKQSSTHFSLYSDTTHYWLRWGGDPGLRYEQRTLPPSSDVRTSFRDTLHLEEDRLYFFGATHESEMPLYTTGEGWYWRSLSQNNTAPVHFDLQVPLADKVTTNTPLSVQIGLIGGSGSAHRMVLEAFLDDGSGAAYRTVGEASFSGYALATLTADLPANEVPAGGPLRLRLVSYNDAAAFPNNVHLDWVEVGYDRAFVTDKQLRVAGQVNQATTFQFTSARSDGYALAPATGVAYALSQETTVDVDATPLWISPAERLLAPVAYAPAHTASGWAEFAGVDYVIVANDALFEAAQTHAAARASKHGFTTAVVQLKEVFDQFDYGRPTPIALRRFVHATQQWDTPARFLALYGDALWPDRKRALAPWEVPSFGIYPSDGWFGMQVDGPDDWSEALAIGRLPLRTDEQAAMFGQKLATYESTPPADWQKKMLLIVGGTDSGEQNTLQSYSKRWGSLGHEGVAAMDSLNFFKASEDVLDLSFQDSLRVAIREGASWLSYFGHSSVYSWEVVTDEPAEYNNAGRLPVVLSLGCRTGTFIGGPFGDRDLLVLGEKLVVESPNGAIAHWGSSGLASIGPSAALSDRVHRTVFEDSVRTLGHAFRRAKAEYITGNQSQSAISHVLQYGLLGDPSTRYVLPTQPDLHLGPDDLRITPTQPIPADSALTLRVRVRNHGLVPSDSVGVLVRHQRGNGTVLEYRHRIPPPRFIDPATFLIPINDNAVGDNVVAVIIDPDDNIQEVDETDNFAQQQQTVFSAGLFVVTPLNDGVVSDTAPLLRFGTTSSEAQHVVFEVDTTAAFGSPHLWSLTSPIEKGIADVRPTGLLESQRYYWRARIEGQPNWLNGTFTTASPGLNFVQSTGAFSDIVTDPFLKLENTRWQFATYPIETSISSELGGGSDLGQIVVGGRAYLRLTLGYGIVVLDGGTGEVIAAEDLPTYEIADNFKARFDTDSTQARIKLQEVVAALRPGDHVLVRTRHLANLSGPTIQPHIKDVFRQLGSTAIDTLTYSNGWIFKVTYGYPSSVVEQVLAPGENQRIVPFYFNYTFPEGTATSRLVGPAQAWDAMRWTAETSEDATIAVTVLDAEGRPLSTASADGHIDMSAIDATAHPYLKLEAAFRDSTQRTTPQLTQWQVAYTPTAEVGLVASGIMLPDTTDEGAPLEVTVPVRNLSPTATSDSLLIHYYVVDPSNTTRLVATDTLGGLTPDAATTSSASLPTLGLAGTSQLIVRLDQPGRPEPVLYNNVLVREFNVRSDAEPPSFTVRINGEALPPDDAPVTNLQDPRYPFVPLDPVIEIVLEDDNPHLLLTDTTLVTLTLGGRRIPFDDPNLLFEPATKSDNVARLHYQAQFAAKDTTHTLRLNVFDASGNEAEGSPYQVHLRTQASVAVDHLFPYPNPMSTATTFAFQLRGADAGLVDSFRVRIYTLNGHPVREFDLVNGMDLDSGMLRIGWNRLRWDGRDDDGDLLATGVYLYTVTFTAEGVTHQVNGGVEKIAIIR